MYRRRSPRHRGDCPLALCCMALGLGVLLAIVVGGAWFGIPGMVLGVPTLAVLAALLKQAVGAGLTARGLPEEPPPASQGKTVTKKAKN